MEIKGNLILSCMRFHPVEVAKEVAYRGSKYVGKGVVGIDLAGAELDGFCHDYIEAMDYAKSVGYRVTIHAGEQGSGQNVHDAITLLGAERIGHGVYIKDHKEAYELVKTEGVVLEMCPTSNVQTKAISEIIKHPFTSFMHDNLSVTLATDNRTVSDTTMTKEYELMSETFRLEEKDFMRVYQTSINGIFGTEETKEWLRTFVK